MPPLSILDLAFVPEDGTPADALRNRQEDKRLAGLPHAMRYPRIEAETFQEGRAPSTERIRDDR